MNELQKLDLRPPVIAIGLSAIGLVTLSCLESGHGVMMRQATWLILGLAMLGLVGQTEIEKIYRRAPLIYGIGILLLVATLFFPSIRGARSWITLGPIRLQPSELMKPCVLIALSAYLGDPNRLRRPYRTLVISGGIVALPLGLILLQPDVGTSLTFLAIYAVCIHAAGLPVRFIMLAGLGAAVLGGRIILGIADAELLLFDHPAATSILHDRIVGGGVILSIAATFCLLWARTRGRKNLGWVVVFCAVFLAAYAGSFQMEDALKNYQRNRILAVVDPGFDPRGASYNVHQSLVAVGSGGLFGKGFSNAGQIRLGFLPEWHTDFVFAGIAELFGFVGAALVLTAYTLLIRWLLRCALRSRVRREAILHCGTAGLISFHILINIGMVLGLVPVIGIPLPLLSYGGSSTLSFWILLGLHQACHRRRCELVCIREHDSRAAESTGRSLIFSTAKR